jgi:polyisoprenoid-binding protein YceI
MAIKKWQFDNAHSQVGFSVKHMMFARVRGTFDEWSGEFYFDPENPAESRVSASIQTASVNTRNEQRDDHLRSGDFFDAENHPALRFESTRWEKIDDGYRVHGDLTIRGTTKPVALEVDDNGSGQDPWGNTRIGLTGRTTLNRKDFGLTWNQALETGGVLVGENVDVELEIQAIEAAAEDSAAAE